MASPDLFYLSLASVASVLLGICVTLRNNAYSTVLRHYNDDIQLGDKDYEPILNRSAYGSMAAGLFFFLSIGGSIGGMFFGPSENLAGWLFYITIAAFSLGLLSLLYALFTGHVRIPESIFRSPSIPDRSERPEVRPDEEPEEP